MTRLAVVISHPIQYFGPLYARLAEMPGVSLKVFYCSDRGAREYRDQGFCKDIAWDIPLLEGYEYEFLSVTTRPGAKRFQGFGSPDVGSRLERYGAEIVWIHGYSQPTMWRAWWWARGRAKCILSGDSELLHPRGLAPRFLKRIFLPAFFKEIDAFLTVGDNNEAYYRFYGVPLAKFFRGAFPIDVERFKKVATSMSPEVRAQHRARYGLAPDATVVVFAGKFTSIKRPFDLVDAMARLRPGSGIGVQALLVGSGPLEVQLRGQVKVAGLEHAVRFTGFVNQAQMPEVLAVADIVVLCSEVEPYGIAITEGMACGNAVLASDRVGCVGPTSPARPGVNTLVHQCGNIDQLAANIRMLGEDHELLARMKSASLEIVQTQDASVVAAAVCRALDSFERPAHNKRAA